MYLVRTDSILPGMIVARNVTSFNGRVLLTAGTVLRESYSLPLINNGIAAIYVVDHLAPDVEPEDVVPPRVRQELAQELSQVMADVAPLFTEATRRGLAKFAVSLNLERLEKTVDRVVDSILRTPKVVYNLQDIRVADDYTLGHSVNVCILSALMGSIMGYRPHELRDLAIGAVLHDIGKVAIPPDIMNKPGPLTPQEFQLMKEHTTYGWQILRSQQIRATAAIMALQHHERWTGGGYPRNLRGDEIYKHSRICALVDVFDAMTADRVYRKGFSPARALDVMATEMKGFFEPGLLVSFMQCVAPYPVGSLVEVNGGRQGVVLEVPRGKTYQPRIRLLLEPDGTPLAEPFELDLDKRPEFRVTRLVREDWTGDVVALDDISPA